MNGISLHLHQQIAALADERYDTVIEEGGVGSGKSLGDAVVILKRSTFDTAQWGGLFANTWPQLQAVTGEIYKHTDAAGVDHVFNCRPPKEWVEEWEEKGIKTPPNRDRFTNVAIFRTGLHLYQATLLNQNYKNLRGWEFGWIIIEEYTNGPSQAAVEFAMERVRCGRAQFGSQYETWQRGIAQRCAAGATIDLASAGGGDGRFELPRHDDGSINPEAITYDHWCRAHHRHTKYLKGNPPEDDGHWTFAWYAAMDAYAATLPGGAPTKDADSYPNLLKGVGSVLYIPSRTKDNERNLSAGYIDNQLARLDEETANKRLNGVRARKRSGLAYSGFSRENEIAVTYHPFRTLYVNLDFNNSPIASGLCHPLNPGEYPDEHKRPNVSHVGKFGEVFDSQGGGLQALCALLLGDGVGNLGAAPPIIRTCKHEDATCHCWRGLLEHKGPVVFFGDGTGNNKSASGSSLWSIVDDVIGKQLTARRIAYSRRTSTANELVPLRVRAHNAKLCSAAGIRSFWIDPRCTNTINDLMSCVWDKHKPDIQKYGERGGSKMHLLTHLSDADGYMLTTLFPMGHEPSAMVDSAATPFGRTYQEPQM